MKEQHERTTKCKNHWADLPNLKVTAKNKIRADGNGSELKCPTILTRGRYATIKKTKNLNLWKYLE